MKQGCTFEDAERLMWLSIAENMLKREEDAIMKPTMCATCRQPLPKRVPQPRDIVEIRQTMFSPEPRLAMLLDVSLNRLVNEKYASEGTNIRVLHLNGPLRGLTSHYAPDRLTVVRGHFHVTERL